jgi:hypothetical protein
LHSIWLAITFSVLSAAAFLTAIALGFTLADSREGRSRAARETWATIAVGVGAVLLLVAVVFWIGYVIFGPVHHAATEFEKRSE